MFTNKNFSNGPISLYMARKILKLAFVLICFFDKIQFLGVGLVWTVKQGFKNESIFFPLLPLRRGSAWDFFRHHSMRWPLSYHYRFLQTIFSLFALKRVPNPTFDPRNSFSLERVLFRYLVPLFMLFHVVTMNKPNLKWENGQGSCKAPGTRV